jgi:hypothetical protein
MDATHIDTCLSCYLQDHHNRPGELLLGTEVDGATSYQEVLDGLLSQLNGLDRDPDSFDYDAAEAAIRERFSTVSDMSKPFDPSLEVIPAEELENAGGEWCVAWFLLEFEEEGA